MKKLILIVGAIATYLLFHDPSDPYWTKVGYEMDRTLNPCKYDKNC